MKRKQEIVYYGYYHDAQIVFTEGDIISGDGKIYIRNARNTGEAGNAYIPRFIELNNIELEFSDTIAISTKFKHVKIKFSLRPEQIN